VARRRGIDVLRRRAVEFLEGAEEALRAGRYGLACFLSEQAVQLYVKSKLLELVGDYPRTHYIRVLLGELLRSIDDERLRRFIRDNRARISSLEDAYLMARYSEKEYFREDAEDAVSLARELIKLIEGLQQP